MSETKSIEERAARICKRLDYIDAWNAGGEEAIELIDDLMAERGKKVNLDEIFPKEVMEKAKWFSCWDPAQGESEEQVLPRYGIEQCLFNLDLADLLKGPIPVVIIAYQRHRGRTSDKELARVRVRLGLTVEIVEEEKTQTFVSSGPPPKRWSPYPKEPK